MAGPTHEEMQDFDLPTVKPDNGDPAPGFYPFSSGGISTTGPSGTALREFKTLKAYLQAVYGTLPEGAVDYNSSDLDGDGVNEVYAVDADGNPHTVYGYDDNNEVESTEFNQWQYDSFLNDIENVETDEDFLDVVNRYESAGIQNNSVVMSMTGPSGVMATPEDVFKDMMEKSGADATAILDVYGVLESDGTFRGILENIDVLIKGVFNLPIPDWIPIPAIFKLPSIADVWDNTFGKVFEGVDEGCFEGEASVSECTGQILSGIGDAAGDLGNTIEEKVTEVYEGVVGAVSNPEDAVKEVYEWLKGIFGEDPLSMPPWIWGVIGAGILGKEILGGLEDIYGTDVDDDGTIGVPPVTPVYGPDNPNPDCVNAGAQTDADGNCVCPEGFEYIEASKSCEDAGPVVNTVEEDCKQKGREYDEVTDSCGDCKLQNYEPDDISGECVEVVNPPPTIDCTQPQPASTPSFNPADNAAHSDWEEACGATHCPDGSVKPESGVCGEQPSTPCNNGATLESDCKECPDGSAPSAHEGGDCTKDLITTTPNPNVFNFDCSVDPRPTGALTFDLVNQQKAWDQQCGGGSVQSNKCASLNRSTNEDGSCGDCLPGYVLDENMDNCVKQEIPVTTTTPPTTTTSTPASSGGGGSSGGTFNPVVRGISYAKQPVPDVLPASSLGMLTGAQPTQNTQKLEQSIVKNLFPEFSSRFLS